ncbi:glycosyltransferase N-terminal domain-containing protein [Sediminimonas sp.]|uniref:3-deoxy-D-manno-octulosonic acid transferase n=1 Tax=Sediminimonas sp. TaxID=2823379 RepID=UPI0025FA8839|nr:glycosyltransferase N-terminal domain-containing protein [Sediminimonas sp.]
MVTRLLGLPGYMALAHGGPGDARADGPSLPPRPTGELVWGHAASPRGARALAALAERLAAQRPGTGFLLTTAADDTMAPPPQDDMIVQPAPPEYIPAIEAFLAHWKPDLCIWTEGALRPALIECAGAAGIAMILADAEEASLAPIRRRPWPDPARAVLQRFDTVLANNANAARRLERLGVPADRIRVTGRLQIGGIAPPCDEADIAALEAAIAGRPVWLAAMVQPGEIAAIAAAHRAALKSAHRRLLIVMPDAKDNHADIARALDAGGWRVAHWARGERPAEATQVLLTGAARDPGLWYRLAPVALIGSSLEPGHGGRDPYAAAALGSAILHGPNVGHHRAAYDRLAAAGAARMVRDADTLAAALVQVIAPEQAAAMAHAAWEVVTEGAEVTDRLIALAQDVLDRREGG